MACPDGCRDYGNDTHPAALPVLPALFRRGHRRIRRQGLKIQQQENGYRLPDRPTIGGTTRAALVDFYFNSWRLVPANIVWAIVLGATIFLLLTFPLAGFVMLVVLALPTAGLFRLSALIVRDGPVAFRDALSAWRQFLGPALLLGLSVGLSTVVLGFNMIVGFTSADPLGWALATLAAWGFLVLWFVTLAFWPLLVDPLRYGEPLMKRVRLAATLVFISPIRYALLALLIAIVLIVSTIMFAALVMVSVAFVSLVATRYVLPAADRLEGRRTRREPILD